MNNNKSSQKPATMRDVAELAGVSQPTVSRVLNKKNTSISISDETRARVLAAVAELNYSPNMLARSLRTQQTQMIAVLVADISNGFYHYMVRAIQDVAREHRFDVMIANSDHVYENEIHFCDAVTRRPVDGVIMVPINLSTEDIDNFIRQTNTPVSILGQHIDHHSADVVYADDAQSIYETTRWLIQEKGHRKIGFIGVPQNYPPGPRRFSGYEKALIESQLTINPKHIVEADFTVEGGQRAAYELLQRGDLPTALIVINDLMAIGAILTLQDAGFRIPEDMAIVGFDDILEAKIIRPALTTIAQDPYDMGYKLAMNLFERVANPLIPAKRLESKLKLIERNST